MKCIPAQFRSPEICNQVVSGCKLPLKAPRETLSLPLPASGGSRQFLACAAYFFPTILGGGTRWGNLGCSYLTTFNLITSAKNFFPNKVTFIGFGGRTWTYFGVGEVPCNPL